MKANWRALIAAFTFLTRLPAGRLAVHDAADLPRAVVFFPVVGLVVGGLGGLTFASALRLWTAPVAVLLAISVTVLATGAFHEDALADAFDGFGGGWNREQVLTIMKDSRVGSYALVGVALVLALKAAALMLIADAAAPTGVAGAVTSRGCRALIAAHVLGRWSSLPLIWRYPYVRRTEDEGRPSAGGPFIAGVGGARVAVATVVAASIVVAALGGRAAAPAIATIGITIICGRYFARRIGGITGDALGAANQLVEATVYLVLAARQL